MESVGEAPKQPHLSVKQEAYKQKRGNLKIFFSYASGAGKTYAMLKAAHIAKKRGIDVAVGYVEPHGRTQTSAQLSGLERISNRLIKREGMTLKEFDLDAAIKRHPDLILIDDLAHTNIQGARHTKRYQDVEELLNEGIDVYTTVNVQHIESLNDTVVDITGVAVNERIPDSIFDNASQVELVDIEPEELLERLNHERGYAQEQIKSTQEKYLTLERLTALREVALRRCADRVNILSEHVRIKNGGDYHIDEHILVCLSSAPSNAKIIRTAARMAKAFHSTFTALFVETPDFSVMSEENKVRLHANMRLARQLGAKIETVYGEDVAMQISEFARLSGVSKIVIGRNIATRRYLFSQSPLTERLISHAPNIDIHIIPDNESEMNYFAQRARRKANVSFIAKDILKSIVMIIISTCIGFLFWRLGFTEANIMTVYILGVLVNSVITTHQIYSLLSSMISVIIFNFFFTVPRFTLLAYDKEYPVTFVIMFLAAFITGSLATKLKNHARQSAQAAYRTQILFDTNQLLEKVRDRNEIIKVTSKQLIKLLNKDLIMYLAENETLSEPEIFTVNETFIKEAYTSDDERQVAAWVLKNNKHAGYTTDTFSNAKCLYMSIRMNENVYGVIGIVVGEKPLDAFENSILLSILGECAMALENEKNIREKEEAALLAQKEELRANLLRSISHDLRTPLTSISGNASNLISNGEKFDEATKKQLYVDIYDDSMWLINLVENLLSITRIEEGRMNLHLSAELIDEVILEALRHVNRRRIEHHITVKNPEEIILAKIDARLIVQVIINIVDNAIKYTPSGSEIEILTKREENEVAIYISDNGPGISDEIKQHVFDMFYSGANKIADSRRSLGLGLSLCKSIIEAHHGKIRVSDHKPQGTTFTFTLPIEEVQLHE